MSASKFLQESIADYQQHLEKNFRHDVVKQNLINTRHLLNSLGGSSSVAGDKATLTFNIPFRGIYHDMKKRNTDVAEEDLFPRRRGSKKWNQRPWYNKNLWGTISYFIGQLVHGYSGDGKEAVTKHFPQP